MSFSYVIFLTRPTLIYQGVRVSSSLTQRDANYPRKPRGGPVDIPEEYLIRQSLCCVSGGAKMYQIWRFENARQEWD